MRDIKFRAWDKQSRRFVIDSKNFYKQCFHLVSYYIGFDGLIYHFSNDKDCLGLMGVSKYLVIMQSTGLFDKFGKEIYEGDIVRILNYLNGKEWQGHCHNSVIEFRRGQFCFNPEWHHESLQSNTVEIIGNIYENPELLEGEPKGT